MKNKNIISFALCIALALIFSFSAPFKAVNGQDGAVYEESVQLTVNPDCGFYKAFAGYLKANVESSPVDKDKMASFAGQYGLFHLRIGLENFSANAGGKDREIDALAIKGLKSALDYLRILKMSAIIRFSYNVTGAEDSSGNYLENEPSITWIVKHVKTLGAVISEYSDVILGVESGMVGPWGEQHSTVMGSHEESNAGTYHKIVQAWLESTPECIGITVRRPLYFTYWMNKQYSLDLSVDDLADFDCSGYKYASRVGVYNDGYLGSSTDLGTFTNRQAEVAFIGKQAQNTYYGGEVVADKNTGSIGSYNSVDYLEKEAFTTHTSYLNIDWNYDYVISKWQANTYKGSDLTYKGKTTQFVFVNNRLGYRHLITGITAPNRGNAGSEYKLSLQIENKGFARMFRKPVATVIIKTPTKTERVVCELDLTTVNSRESKEFELKFNLSEKLKGECEVYLNLQTAYGRTVYLANSSELTFDSELNAYKLCDIHVDNNLIQESYLVTFDANHGRIVSGKSSQVVKRGESAIAPAVERNGYRFIGWSCDFSNVTQNLSVVALWEKIEEESSSADEVIDSSFSEDEDSEVVSSSQSSPSNANGTGCASSVHSNCLPLLALTAILIIMQWRKQKRT